MVLGKQPCLEREMVTPPPPIDDVTTEDKENFSPSSGLDATCQMKGERPKKKSAMFAETVQVLFFLKTLFCQADLFQRVLFCRTGIFQIAPGAGHRHRIGGD